MGKGKAKGKGLACLDFFIKRGKKCPGIRALDRWKDPQWQDDTATTTGGIFTLLLGVAVLAYVVIRVIYTLDSNGAFLPWRVHEGLDPVVG